MILRKKKKKKRLICHWSDFFCNFNFSTQIWCPIFWSTKWKKWPKKITYMALLFTVDNFFPTFSLTKDGKNRQWEKMTVCVKRGGKKSSTGDTAAIISGFLSLFSTFLTLKRSWDYCNKNEQKYSDLCHIDLILSFFVPLKSQCSGWFSKKNLLVPKQTAPIFAKIENDHLGENRCFRFWVNFYEKSLILGIRAVCLWSTKFQKITQKSSWASVILREKRKKRAIWQRSDFIFYFYTLLRTFFYPGKNSHFFELGSRFFQLRFTGGEGLRWTKYAS